MSKFKEGAKVRCAWLTDDNGERISKLGYTSNGELFVGHEYVVLGISSCGEALTLKGLADTWFADRFELVEPAPVSLPPNRPRLQGTAGDIQEPPRPTCCEALRDDGRSLREHCHDLRVDVERYVLIGRVGLPWRLSCGFYHELSCREVK